MPPFAPASTALILIDLQHGIAERMELAPRTGAEVVERAKVLAASFRAAGAPVVLVHVGFTPETMPSQTVDKPALPAGGTPPEFQELVEGLRQPGDTVVLKRHWGAFTGTDLDLTLRRRGVKTVVIAGIATNFGVESTARSAWEHSYDVIIVEDVCTSRSAELHRFAIDNILPAISRVTTADAIGFDAG